MVRQLPPAADNEVKQVGIWIRVSTEDQAKGESPEHHERRARSYADVKGWNVREVYNLAGVSGKAVMHHPEAKRMLEHLKSGHIKGLIFSKLARLARNTRELLDFADIFRDQGADLISLQESIDTSTPAGRLFYTMIAAMAQWEREEITDRINVSIPIRAKLGKPIGGHPPYGYHWKDKRLVPHPEEAIIRKLVYELFAEHRRKKTVAQILNRAGHRTRGGCTFTGKAVERIITDSTAKGTYRANFTRMLKGKAVLKPEKDWIFTTVEPLISEELWERCNLIITEGRAAAKPVAKRAVHLFAGVTYCHCGNKMYVPSNTPKYVCQKCRNKIPIVDLDNVFYEQLKGFFVSPDDMSAYIGEADKTLKQKQEVLEVLQKELQRVTTAMDKVYDLYIGGQLAADGFGSRYKPLEERSKQLDEEIPRLQAEIDLIKISYLSRDEILSNAKDLYARWDKLTYEEKRTVTEAITHKIIIGKSEIDIDLCYLPPSPPLEMMAKGGHNVGVVPGLCARERGVDWGKGLAKGRFKGEFFWIFVLGRERCAHAQEEGFQRAGTLSSR